MDLVWHLCDIFFLRSPILLQTNKPVLNDIFDWVEEHMAGAFATCLVCSMLSFA
jgi:hypothetical protein